MPLALPVRGFTGLLTADSTRQSQWHTACKHAPYGVGAFRNRNELVEKGGFRKYRAPLLACPAVFSEGKSPTLLDKPAVAPFFNGLLAEPVAHGEPTRTIRGHCGRTCRFPQYNPFPRRNQFCFLRGIFARLAKNRREKNDFRRLFACSRENRADPVPIEIMMMDPAVKTAMAFCVVAGGVCAALLLGRGDHGPLPPRANPSAEQLSIPGKKAKGPGVFNRLRSRRSGHSTAPEYSAYPRRDSGIRPSPATVLTPSRVPQQPPPLAEEYPQYKQRPESSWGQSLERLLPVPRPMERSNRTHKIADGDTLASLAERYLGTPRRAGEIYETNRDVLFDPQLLPIGVELKIPPK